MDVVIYLSDNTGHQFTLHNGKTTPTSQLLQIMIATLKLPDQLAKKCFSLWLKSPLLDVQLKPQHIPFKMVKQWPTLIERFAMGTELEKAHDEPALLFRRNAFLTKEDEAQITDESVLKILQLEAKFNIQQGVYPCDEEDIEQLGALMCMEVEEKPTEIQKIVKENMSSLVPSHMAKVKRHFMVRQHSMEERIVQCAKKVSKEVSVHPVVEFMKICWQLPYYGSVMFNGLVERAQSSALASWFLVQTEIPVRVAINTDGIWIIDTEKKHVLLGLLYDEFNWEVTDIQMVENDDVKVPCLFLEFSNKKTGTNQLLGVISKQAPMMNSMIETCIAMKREKPEAEAISPKAEDGGSSSCTSPTAASTRVRPLFQRQNSVTSSRPEKLNLKRIDEPPPSDGTISPTPRPPNQQQHASKKKIFGGAHKKFGGGHKSPVTKEEQFGLL